MIVINGIVILELNWETLIKYVLLHLNTQNLVVKIYFYFFMALWVDWADMDGSHWSLSCSSR